MANTQATATIENDVNFTLIKLGTNNQNESAELNYSRALTDGSGSLQINYGVISSGSLPSGGSLYFDMQALDKIVFGATTSVQFSRVKSFVVENVETVYTSDIAIRATGANAFTEPFNGGSGNVLIKPYSVYQYSDPISGALVDAKNKDLSLLDVSGTGATYKIVVVGVTG
jgi:hypothetical protein